MSEASKRKAYKKSRAAAEQLLAVVTEKGHHWKEVEAAGRASVAADKEYLKEAEKEAPHIMARFEGKRHERERKARRVETFAVGTLLTGMAAGALLLYLWKRP